MKNRNNIANQYLDFVNNNTIFPKITNTINSLKLVVSEVGGNPEAFDAERLADMTALDLIASIAPNNIRFRHLHKID